MPSFPDAIFSPASKNNGDTIQAAHVTDLDAEVVAIEQGLRNGTAPLNSSNSTLTALVVTNGSTLTTLSVSGGSTFASRPVTPPPDAVSVTGSTTGLAHNSTAAVAWPTQLYATNSSLHSTGANPERFIPQSTGIYVLAAQLTLNSTPGSTAYFRLTVEDSSGATIAFASVGNAGDEQPSASLVATKRFDAVGGYLRLVALHTTGSTSSLNGGRNFASFYKL